MSDAYRFGIEEEYFLVDAETKATAPAMPAEFLAQAKAATGGRAMSEMLQSQIEVATAPHTDVRAAPAELVRAGVVEDSSYVWWAIRPSRSNPTLELRAPDCCTRVDDSIAIAALYRALARHLTRTPALNAGLSAVGRALAIENKWRAQRYGISGTFVDATLGAVKVADMLERTVTMIEADARALGSLGEVAHCLAIARSGTSADAQLAVFAAQTEHGDPLRAVIEWIAQATLH